MCENIIKIKHFLCLKKPGEQSITDRIFFFSQTGLPKNRDAAATEISIVHGTLYTRFMVTMEINS